MDFSETELPPLNAAKLPSAAQMFPDDEDEVQTSPPAISPTPSIAPSRDCTGRPAQPCDMSPQAEHESPAPGLTRQTTLPVRAAGNTRSILRPSPANRVHKTNTVSNASPVPAAGADDQQTAEEPPDVEAEMHCEVQERRLSNDENEVQFVPSNLPSRHQQQSVSMPFIRPRMKTRDAPSGIMELFQLNMLEEQEWRREQRELDRQREIAREARKRAREEREAARQDSLLELVVISFGAQHKHYEAGSTKPNNTSGDH
ncbi:hypothetical protein FGB62_69g111 [Gracilaria domingensis]|nr:hypothetical protein FGB62_69g111 [Gracilaria domingensis]